MVGRGAFSQCPKSISSSLSEMAVCTLTGAEESNCVIHKYIVHIYNHVTNIYILSTSTYLLQHIFKFTLQTILEECLYIGNQNLSII